MTLGAKTVLVALYLCSSATTGVLAQTRDAAVPPTAARLLAQLIWPRTLFDSIGQPESEMPGSAFQPDFGDLRVGARDVTVSGLPGVRFFVASAYPKSCWHCATRLAAVAQRGASFIALQNADQLEDLLAWADPPIAEADSNAIREFVIATASATCLLGCDPLIQVRSKAELQPRDASTIEPTGQTCAKWAFPRTYTHGSPGQLTMEFVLYRPGEALYRVLVQQQQNGRSLSISVTQVATVGLPI